MYFGAYSVYHVDMDVQCRHGQVVSMAIHFNAPIQYMCICVYYMCVHILCVSKGILVTVRAVISESSSDSNQAFGLSILTFSWLVAVVSSSALSGVTADPIGQYNLTLSSMCLQTIRILYVTRLIRLIQLIDWMLALQLYSVLY